MEALIEHDLHNLNTKLNTLNTFKSHLEEQKVYLDSEIELVQAQIAQIESLKRNSHGLSKGHS